ncbi:unnamed protein product [Paramecium sonneborni]|uniref:Amino acid transporter transmembrane domain-containing protein n=1 Tax=Paramecium sonneborni TaxID=65129 RepID=A0A8S1M6X9_9CILI|nr:unnamed protein product [Paramecium sonneborni]
MKVNNQQHETYDEIQGSFSLEDDENQINCQRYSIEEIPTNQLSGDEAIEKSFMQSIGKSSILNSKTQKTSIPLTAVIIMKSMVGVGILGVPYVTSNFGGILTTLILIIIFCIGILSSILLLKCKNLSRRSNISTIGFFVFKHKWIVIVINLIIISSNLGVCLSELIIFGDTCSNLVNYFSGQNSTEQPIYLSRPLLIIIASVVLFPFLIVKQIEKLKFVSLFALLSIGMFTCSVVYNYFLIEKKNDTFTWWLPENFSIIRAMASMPTLILAFCWQFNLFPIYKGMTKITDRNLIISTILGFVMGSILYLLVGILGFATYGIKIEPNYLLSINDSDVGGPLFVLLNLSFVLSTTLTIPLMFFAGRNNFIQLIKQLQNNKTKILSKNRKNLLENQNKDLDYNTIVNLKKKSQAIRFYGISIILFLMITVEAIFLRNLGIVYNLLGSITCNAIQLGLPTLFYIFLAKQVKRMKFRNIQNRIFYYLVCLLLLLSIFLTFFCVTSEFV